MRYGVPSVEDNGYSVSLN
jgi:hypothetical protein